LSGLHIRYYHIALSGNQIQIAGTLLYLSGSGSCPVSGLTAPGRLAEDE